MKIVVGLGNPGREYVGTRHNVGWEVLDRLARRLGWTRRDDEFDRLARTKFDGLAMDGPAGLERMLLLKPTTFMNLSGRAVQAAASFFQLTPKDCLIVLDDVALPTGRLRLRGSGSSGGHNGLKDVERALGTDAYPRLRVGVDAPPQRVPQRDYVLGKFTDAQWSALEPTVDRACDAVLTWAEK
ncbi:MAG TPA: aminoacyl-tRNA hydrolase, partial [Tepidisphaeraceae bacterium]|nr:aminoacyl-tRNA hydrolase [Tepidisphaeraceae bacterium]